MLAEPTEFGLRQAHLAASRFLPPHLGGCRAGQGRRHGRTPVPIWRGPQSVDFADVVDDVLAHDAGGSADLTGAGNQPLAIRRSSVRFETGEPLSRPGAGVEVPVVVCSDKAGVTRSALNEEPTRLIARENSGFRSLRCVISMAACNAKPGGAGET